MSESDVDVELYHLRNQVARLEGYIDDLRAELTELRTELQNETVMRRQQVGRINSLEHLSR